MRLVFCGTPEFALPAFRHLLAEPNSEIVGVITQPDRPRGRGGEVSFSPIKKAALEAKIPVHQPERIRAPEVQALLQKLAPDAVAIIAYGQIVPARLLCVPKLGWINLHASLLPKYRGAAPINWVIANGETKTGVTTMRIDAGMDTGDILLQEEVSIEADETAPELAQRLANLGAPLMSKTLRSLADGSVTPRPQSSIEVSLAPILKREDGRIHWQLTAKEIFDRIRGFAPWPGAFTTFRGQACHIWGEPASNEAGRDSSAAQGNAKLGAILVRRQEVFIQCGGATHLRVTSVKLEGRRELSAAEFLNGARLRPGERFGET